ncbi:hypothetical protein DOTSEDRAFT_152882 [Dothistroma septosporum NZE10]|uniref:Uncharacterized protein n=1 Tax=Dothistroma septosporum (strain NZE10 / CBS 128990) TaxID=675120 RepID=N1PR41_DOTSN|nr:hypothetical protein DOTSEDRAFT_152882 [Dothistroma septosporum NZE10]
MATAEVASRPADHPIKKKPFANFIRKLGIKTNDSDKAKSSKKANSKKSVKNNPYPESGHLQPQQQTSQPSFGESQRHTYSSSFASLPASTAGQEHGNSNKSGAPTLATNPETVHSDAGNSRAATTTTGAGALSSMDGQGANSTFSSPNHSDHSLATTLTTIQSQANAVGGPNGISGHNYSHNNQSQDMGTSFSHQYPVSPSAGSTLTGTASAIPRHLHNDANTPATYNSATANNLLSDNASILTLASSSKRRRRSMDTDASVRAMAPNSVFGGSRESLPLSVLSSNVNSGDAPRQSYSHGVYGSAAAERASVYSSSGLRENMVSPVPPGSERNSYYAKQSDAKSLRSINNLKDDTRSITGIYPRSELDNRSLNTTGDVASLRSFEVNSNSHARTGSIPGSIGNAFAAPSLLRQASGATALSLGRRDSDWREGDDEEPTAVDLEDERQKGEKKHG